MKLLILGANGFVGKSVSSILKAYKDDLQVNEHCGRNDCDLRDYDQTLIYLQKISPDIIINLAAHVGSLKYVSEHAREVYIDNSTMTNNLYKALSFLEMPTSLINIVANCVYPSNNDVLLEKGVLNGEVHESVFSYGMSRRHLLSMARCFHGKSCIKSINLIAPNMFGPGDSSDPVKAHALNAILGKFCRAERHNSNKTVEIWGSGKPVREWLYAPDLGRFLARFIISGDYDAEKMITILNVAQGAGFSISEITAEIAKHFGSEILMADGGLDRGALRQVIFHQEEEKHWLEELLHPLIRRWLTQKISSCRTTYCLLVSPLLLETGQAELVDRILVVDVSIDTQIARTLARDGGEERTVRAIIASQIGRSQRLEYADDIIGNELPIELLRKRVEKLHQGYLAMAGAKKGQ